MFDLEEEDIYIPNTEAMRKFLKSLNYKLAPLDDRTSREFFKYRSLCFVDWILHFERVKQTNNMYFSMSKPTLTEDQSIFVMNILHVCPDYATFKEALQQYINKPLE